MKEINYKKNRTFRNMNKWVITFILSLYAFICIYPIFYIIANSLKTRYGYAQNRLNFPITPTIENFIDVLNRFNFWRILLNTVITTFGGVLLSVVVCFLASYALTKMRIFGGKYILFIIIGTITIPVQVVLYPLYQTVVDMGLNNSYIGLILVYGAFHIPLGLYLISSYLRGIPNELIESAQIDGANPLQIILKIIIPISKPALATLTIINTVWMWNNLLLPLLILSQEEKTTLMLKIALIRNEYDIHIPLMCAGLTIAIIPIIIVYLIGQKQLIKGMTAGALK